MRFDIPAPPGFWKDLRRYHGAVMDRAADADGGWWLRSGESAWRMVEEPDQASTVHDRMVTTQWEGRSRMGGLVIWGRLRLIQPLVSSPAGTTPVTEKKLVYNSHVGFMGPVVVTHTSATDMEGNARTASSRSELRAEMASGIMLPTQYDFEQILTEMERGASGEYSVGHRPE